MATGLHLNLLMMRQTVAERELREQIAKELEEVAVILMKSNEYNFNDTAVRAKAFFFAAELVREKNG